MTRVGWTVLALFALVFAGLAAITHVSGAREGDAPRVVGSASIHRASVGAQLASRRRLDGDAGETAPLPLLAVPVWGVFRQAVTDTWGQARSEGRVHHGTDIVAPRGTAVLAAAPGVIEKLWQSARGGTTIYERSSDRQWTFYYAHLAAYAPGLHEEQFVKTGEPIGYVGDTGDAGAGNYHLHFGLTRTAPDQRWYQGEDVNAYPALAQLGPRR